MIIEVTSLQQLRDLIAGNQQKKLFVLKHSTRCPISGNAFRNYKKFCDVHHEVDCALVYVIENHDVSDLLSELSQIEHESPQVLLFEDGNVVWSEHHFGINYEALMGQCD